MIGRISPPARQADFDLMVPLELHGEVRETLAESEGEDVTTAANQEKPERPGALDGLRVVELPCLDPMPLLAAAMAGKIFADHGAEVIKVEPRGSGSVERRLGPFPGGKPDREASGLHLYLNASKLGVTLDLENPQSRDLLFAPLDSADFLLNPNPPALNERLGIDWRTLIARFPRLIVVSLTFFGAESPYRNLRGGDLIATHMSAVGYETPFNQVIDPPNQPPLKIAERQSDYVAGITGAAAAMAALFHRNLTGRGQHVDVSQWLGMVSMVRPNIGVFFHDAQSSPHYQRLLMRLKVNQPWIYPCKDGWVSFSTVTNRFWTGTKRVLGNPEWAEGEIFDTVEARLQNADALEAALLAWFGEHGKEEIFRLSQAEHVPCFAVQSPAEIARNEQYEAHGYFVDQSYPGGQIKMPGALGEMTETPWRRPGRAPRLGEHNRRVFVERLKFSEEKLRTLIAEGTI
jgi:crotonobetainyl-CoA:carnitine CoA-transferase CaiB-like acyl-CoA transferase